jgi:hypothetical protein
MHISDFVFHCSFLPLRRFRFSQQPLYSVLAVLSGWQRELIRPGSAWAVEATRKQFNRRDRQTSELALAVSFFSLLAAFLAVRPNFLVVIARS